MGFGRNARKGQGKAAPRPTQKQSQRPLQKVIKNVSKQGAKSNFKKGGGKGRNFEDGPRRRNRGSQQRGMSGKGFGKQDRSQQARGFSKGAGRKGTAGGKNRQDRGNRRQERGNVHAEGLRVVKATFQKKLGRFARKGAQKVAAQGDGGEGRKLGKFARKGAKKIGGQRDGERRKGSGKGHGDKSEGRRGFRNRSKGGNNSGAPKAPVKLGKFAQKTKRGRGKGKGKGKGDGQWVFVPDGQTKKKVLRNAETGKGGKRGKGGKGGGKSAEHPNPKVALNSGLSLVLGRNVTKDDCDYNLTEADGKFTALLTIAELQGDKKEFKGQPAKTENDAERNAAKHALNQLAGVFKKARASRQEVVEEKMAGVRAARKEKFLAKREEKRAAKKESKTLAVVKEEAA